MLTVDILVYVRGVDMDSKVTICGVPHTIKYKEEMPWEKTEVSNSSKLLDATLKETDSV